MTCRFAHDDGAYVLGALSPADRREFEQHLPGCADCTRSVAELAGLPGLLGRVDVALLEEPEAAGPVPATLLPALAAEVRRDRRRRTRVVAGLAAAAVAVLAGVTTVTVLQVTGDDPATTTIEAASGAKPRAMVPVGEVPVRASVTLEPVTWGTRLGIECTYETDSVEYDLPPAVDYTLWVRTRDGHAERVGSWRSVDGQEMRMSAGTAATLQDLISVEVRTADGRVVLELAT